MYTLLSSNESYQPKATTINLIFFCHSDLPSESPIAVGLHPNSEIAVRTEEARNLFSSIQRLQPHEASAGSDGISDQSRANQVVETILDKLEDAFFDLVGAHCESK